MHDSYLDLQKPHYFTAIVLWTFCWFKPHPFASSKAVLYTKRDCCEINIFPLSTITLSMHFRGKIRAALFSWVQSPWHLFKMRLKRHAAVKKKEANFSVTRVIESLQAQWPALVKNTSRVYPILNDKKWMQHGENQLHYYVHLFVEQEDWVWLHDLVIPTHLQVGGFSVPSSQCVHFIQAFLGLAHHWVFRALGIFLVLLWVMFLIWIIYPRETRLWTLALVFKEHLVCS